jgi:hypothetical protein
VTRACAGGRLALAFLIAVALGATGAAAPPVGARGTDPVALVQAFSAAWNAHEPDAVAALFADQATVPSLDVLVPESGTSLEFSDAYGVRAILVDPGPAVRVDGTTVVWAPGPAQIRAWAHALFTQDHRAQDTNYRAHGDWVIWDYRVSVDPYQRYSGVGPTEGQAEAGTFPPPVMALSLTASRASVRRRDAAMERVVRTASASWNSPTPAHRGVPPVGPWTVAVALSLTGVVALAMLKRPSQRPQAARRRDHAGTTARSWRC